MFFYFLVNRRDDDRVRRGERVAECAREGVFVRIVEAVSADGFPDLFGGVRLEPPDQALGNERREVVGIRHVIVPRGGRIGLESFSSGGVGRRRS